MAKRPRTSARTTRKQVTRPILVKTVAQTCNWCPSQWEGRTVDRRPIYARYRYGCLCVHVGRIGGTIRNVIKSGKELVRESIGDRWDGVMTYAELKRHTRGVIEWPKTFRRKGLSRYRRVLSPKAALKRLRKLHQTRAGKTT